MQLSSSLINIPAVLKHGAIKVGDTVADFGTGREGKIALPAAKLIGVNGQAYAVDVVKTILPTIQTKARMHGLNNVVPVWSDLERYGATKTIRDNTLAAGFVVTVLFQSKQHEALLKECQRMVRPGGRLEVADWKPGVNAPLGPVEDMRVHPEEIKQLAGKLGMQLAGEFEAGPYHWGLVFIK